MTKITVDFSQVESFEAIPGGKYPVIIESVEIKESKSSEYSYLNFTLVVNDGGEYQNRKLWFIGSLSPKALFRLKSVFDSFGFEGDQAELDYDPGSGILLTPSFVGLSAFADVSVEVYDNKDRNRVQELYAGDGATITKSSPKGDVLVKKSTPVKATPTPAVEEEVVEASEVVETETEAASEVEAEAQTPATPVRANPFAPKTDTPARKVFK